MKIGIVLHPYGEKNPAGLGRAIFEITKSLVQEAPNHQFVIFLKNPETPLSLPGKNWRKAAFTKKEVQDVDVCIFNTPILPLTYRAKRSVVILYDFAYLTFSPNRLLRWYHGYSLKRADQIVAISEATKREAIRLYGLKNKSIEVVPLGYTSICALPPKPVKTPGNYFLFVGAIKERKNVENIVMSFHHLLNRGVTDYGLVIAGNGKGGYYEKIRSYVNKYSLEKQITFLGYVSDEEVSYLYKHAVALVYPSFIEGFGFPVLEAMDCGLPVITSTTSSLPEVAGEAALLVDPYSKDAITDALERLVRDKGLREELVKKGHEQRKKFSWEKTGKQLLSIIEAQS